jgi:nitronate monooxygenase
MDPDALGESDPSAMNFGSDAAAGPKPWKDIWGSGQGIGAVSQQQSVAELVETLRTQYDEALAAPLRHGRQPSFA